MDGNGRQTAFSGAPEGRARSFIEASAPFEFTQGRIFSHTRHILACPRTSVIQLSHVLHTDFFFQVTPTPLSVVQPYRTLADRCKVITASVGVVHALRLEKKAVDKVAVRTRRNTRMPFPTIISTPPSTDKSDVHSPWTDPRLHRLGRRQSAAIEGLAESCHARASCDEQVALFNAYNR